MAPRAATDDAVTGEGDFTCECGRKFAYGGAYTKHKLKCDGQPAPTSRIAGGAGAAAKVVSIDEAPGAPAKKRRRDTKPAIRRKRRRIASKAVRVSKRSNKNRRRGPLPVSRPQMRGQNRKPAAIVATLEEAAISPKQMLAALRAELDKIQTAIAAVEALG